MPIPFQQHIERLFACRACPTVAGLPVTGAVEGARVMLVGQAPGPREESFGRPFAYTAGQRLFRWFEQIGMDEAAFRRRVHIGAVIRCFPGRAAAGGDRLPSPAEISRCRVHLDTEIALLRPLLVIAVGTVAAKELVGRAELRSIVGVVQRVERAGHSFDVVVLPHPSGRSTWLNKPENAELLEQSLRLIESRMGPG
jgi:uracil-DNA glycosylase